MLELELEKLKLEREEELELKLKPELELEQELELELEKRRSWSWSWSWSWRRSRGGWVHGRVWSHVGTHVKVTCGRAGEWAGGWEMRCEWRVLPWRYSHVAAHVNEPFVWLPLSRAFTCGCTCERSVQACSAGFTCVHTCEEVA